MHIAGEKVSMQEKNSYQKIYEVVKQIPRGTVATYGQVAALAGNRKWARVVGYALHVNPAPESIPCYSTNVKLYFEIQEDALFFCSTIRRLIQLFPKSSSIITR